MKAHRILKENVQALLRERGYHAKDLADWCGKSESWISHIFKNDKRTFSIWDLDKIADFFGYGTTYQLFQPGISATSERRKYQRRHRVADEGQQHLHL